MYKPTIAQFTELVRSFCNLAEQSVSERNQQTEVEQVIEIVAALYASALNLPIVSGKFWEGSNVDNNISEAIFKRFGSLPFNYYSCVNNPEKIPGEEPSIGDLADDLRDMCVDLKSGLLFYDAGDVEQAICEWKSSFDCHWRQHAANTLYVLDYYIYKHQYNL